MRTGYSVQQIRDLEALSVIAPATRAANGYRRFSAHHVRDLHAYRDLAAAVGPVAASRAMREIRSLPPDEAPALVSSFHTALNRERDEASEDPSTYEEADSYSADQTGYDYAAGGQSTTEPDTIG